MLLVTLLLAIFGGSSYSSAKPLPASVPAAPVNLKRHSSGLPYTTRSVPLTGRLPRQDRSPLETLARRDTKDDNGTHVDLYGPLGGTVYTVPITIGTQNFTVRIDTGSSDLWVHAKTVLCPPPASTAGNQTTGPVDPDPSVNSTSSGCYFKSAGYDPQLNPNFHLLPYDANYNQSFSGGLASGIAGLDDITFAGITVDQQEFGLVAVASPVWGNLGTNDGIFGLASPSLTAVHGGSNGANDSTNNLRPYNPWIYNAVNQSLIKPFFTVNLNRPTYEQRIKYENISNYGTLTIGGIDNNIPDTGAVVTVPNVGVPNPMADNDTPDSLKKIFYWSVNITAYEFPGSLVSIPAEENTTPYSILDTGTAITQIPRVLADAWHQSVQPPGMYWNDQLYLVQCNATFPDFGFTVNGTKFVAKGENFRTAVPMTSPSSHNLARQIPEGMCFSGIQLSLGGSTDTAIIGDNVLWDVLFVADLERNEITLIQKPDETQSA